MTGRIKPRGMLVTDFDGTLRLTQGGLGKADWEALEKLASLKVVRAIATGRSLFSFNRTVTEKIPIDYIIFSSGAGVLDASDSTIVRKNSLDSVRVSEAAAVLKEHELDFMIHRPIPDNHAFVYHATGRENYDFEHRIELYGEFAALMNAPFDTFGEAAQLLAVVPEETGVQAFEGIKQALTGFTVIRTTSPLDGRSVWIEIFPPDISKSMTSAWLAETLGVEREDVFMVGNDWNDLDMLEWAGQSYVVANSPPELRERFINVASNNDGGVAEAVEKWLTGRSDNLNGGNMGRH